MYQIVNTSKRDCPVLRFKAVTCKLVIITCIMLNGILATAQQIMPLYDGLPPGNLQVSDREESSKPESGRPTVRYVTHPTLTAFVPEHQDPSHTAVIICPGGGYLNLSIEDGGYEVAKQLAAAGITAFVLKYRTWREDAFVDYRNIPMQDLQQALKMVYNGNQKWNIDTAHVGLLGFSAGGHLVASAATSTVGIRPAFTILVYPVISFMDALTSPTSKTRNTLLGKNATLAEKTAYSPELHVTANTPPAFLVQAENDSTSLVGNSIAYYQALVANKVPGQLLLYQKGGHGFAYYNKAQDEHWMPTAIKWLALNGFYKK